MPLTGLGFVFLLLPLSALLYYATFRAAKPYLLLLASAFFLAVMEPDIVLILLLSLSIDVACSAVVGRQDAFATVAYGVAVVKSLLLMLLLGLWRPYLLAQSPPVGLFVLSLSGLCALTLQRQQKLPAPRPIALAGSLLFFGALPVGPFPDCARLIPQVGGPVPLPGRIGDGAMRFVRGVFKRVVIAEQLGALLKTLYRVDPAQETVGLAWLTALCCAMELYYILSAYGDMAAGVGGIFSLELPHLTYYPFQAKSPREYVYRLNMSLEETLGRILFRDYDRDTSGTPALVVSMLTPFMLCLLLRPSFDGFLWALWLSGLVALEGALSALVPLRLGVLGRIVTFVVALPAYALLTPGDLAVKSGMLLAMGGGGLALHNDQLVYLVTSNYALLGLAVFFCTSLTDTLSRMTKKQFPQLWWVTSAVIHGGLLAVTCSFLLWNAR